MTLKDKAEQLTQRLDHMVPDPELTQEQNAAAAHELKMLSDALFELLPDKSLSPMERVERMARVVEAREPKPEHLKSAAEKLAELKLRINELVPGEHSHFDKLLGMQIRLNSLVGLERANLSAIQKLEIIGDPLGKIEPE